MRLSFRLIVLTMLVCVFSFPSLSVANGSAAGQVVKMPGMIGVENVKITATPTGISTYSGETYTDANGIFNIELPVGWTGILTPSKDNYTFWPSIQAVSIISTSTLPLGTWSCHPFLLIHGTVLDQDGNPFTPCDLYATTGESSFTSGSGEYYLLVEPEAQDFGAWYKWTGTVTPSRIGFTFDPVNRTYTDITADQMNQDYTANFVPVHIYGHVESDAGGGMYVGIADVAIQASTGESTNTVADGFYGLTVPWGWSGTITPSKSGWNFSPVSRTYSNVVSDQTVQNYLGTVASSVIGEDGIPIAFKLRANYPNPFNPITTIEFDLPNRTHVFLAVYDLLGNEVVRLIDGMNQAGSGSVQWNGTDAKGQPVPSGVYIYRLLAGDFTQSRKLVLSR